MNSPARAGRSSLHANGGRSDERGAAIPAKQKSAPSSLNPFAELDYRLSRRDARFRSRLSPASWPRYSESPFSNWLDEERA